MQRSNAIALTITSLLALGALGIGAVLYRQNTQLSVRLEAMTQTFKRQQTLVARAAERDVPPQRRRAQADPEQERRERPPQWGRRQDQAGEGANGPGRGSQAGGRGGQPGRMLQEQILERKAAGEDVSELRQRAERLRALLREGRSDEAGELMKQLRNRMRGQPDEQKRPQRDGKHPPTERKSRPQQSGARAKAVRASREASERLNIPPMRPEEFAAAGFGGFPGRGPSGGRPGRGGDRREATLLIENDRVAVRMNPAEASFRIYDKLTRRTWSQVVPAKPFTFHGAAGERDRIVGEVQAEIPCQVELALTEGVGDVLLTIRPKDIFSREEEPRVLLNYPYPFHQGADGRIALPLHEQAGIHPAPPVSGEWLYPADQLTSPWIGLTSKAASLVCVFQQAPSWNSALRVGRFGRGAFRSTVLAPVWRNRGDDLTGALSVLYHVTSGTSYAKLRQAFETLAVDEKEREQ